MLALNVVMLQTFTNLAKKLRHFDPRFIFEVGIVFLLAACASTPNRLEQSHAYLETTQGYVTNGKDVKIYFDSIDGQRSSRCCTWVMSGLHKIVIEVEWSNGYVEKVEFSIDTEPRGKYLFGAFELKPGQDQTDAVLRRKTFAEDMADAGLEGAAEGALVGGGWIVAMPIWLFSKHSKHEHAKERPFERCCFIWIEDADNHKLIEGKRPSGITKHGLDRRQ